MGNAKKNRCNTPGILSINVTAEHPKNLSSAGRWISVHTVCVGTCVVMHEHIFVYDYVFERGRSACDSCLYNLVSYFMPNSHHIERIGQRVALGSAVVLPQSYKTTTYTEPKLSFTEVICFLMFGKLLLRTKLLYLLPTGCTTYRHRF